MKQFQPMKHEGLSLPKIRDIGRDGPFLFSRICQGVISGTGHPSCDHEVSLLWIRHSLWLVV